MYFTVFTFFFILNLFIKKKLQISPGKYILHFPGDILYLEL